jgi:hypothetical protein
MGKVGKDFVLLLDVDAALSNLEQERVAQLVEDPTQH